MSRKSPWLTLACSLLALPLSASTFVAIGADELIGRSDLVVQGRVVGLESFWDESGTLIVTEATIEVSDRVLGSSPSRITVRTAGGAVGSLRVEALGFPQLGRNEDVVLFLERDASSHRIVGYQQGHYRVVVRDDGVVLAVPMVEQGTRLMTAAGTLLPEPAALPLDELKSRIRQRAAALGRGLAR